MKPSTAKSAVWITLLIMIWGVVALTILLVPAPREWGAFGQWVSPYYDRVQHRLEPAVHISLMATIAIILMHGMRSSRAATAVARTMVISLLLAIVLEGLQFFLPTEFARKCDMRDLVPSMIGIVAGCLVGLFMRIRSRVQ